MQQQLNSIFAKANLRLTRPRIEVFNTLKSIGRPMSIVEIIHACPGVDKVSIYRTIDVFIKLHVVSTIPHGWKHLYELSAPFTPHHHHLVCDKCGHLTEIQSKNLEHVIATLTNEYGFTATNHHFEISGTCKDCSSEVAV